MGITELFYYFSIIKCVMDAYSQDCIKQLSDEFDEYLENKEIAKGLNV